MYLAVKENTALSLHSRLGENRLALLIPCADRFHYSGRSCVFIKDSAFTISAAWSMSMMQENAWAFSRRPFPIRARWKFRIRDMPVSIPTFNTGSTVRVNA